MQFSHTRDWTCTWELKATFQPTLLSCAVLIVTILIVSSSYISTCPIKQLTWCQLVVIVWSCKLARVASCLTVPPRLSHAPFQSEVAKKGCSALSLRSSFQWHKFKEFFLFLYCGAASLENQIIFLGCNLAGGNSFRKAMKDLWKRWTATVSWWRQSEITT